MTTPAVQLDEPHASAGFSLRIARIFDAPCALVYRAWTEHDHLMRWFCPKDFSLLFYETDVRIGGKWRSGMRSPEGDDFIHGGVYRDIDPPHRLVFTHRWEKNSIEPDCDTQITVTLVADGEKTAMTFEQTGLGTAASRDSHHTGWSGAFDNLIAALGKAHQ